MPALPELLRPPPHRGPLIAAGAVLLTLGLGLVELRLGGSIASGLQLLFLAVGAYSIALRTGFNGFYPDDWAIVDGE